MKTVSIVVPVYNAAAYLADCIRSLTHQSHTALEILLVNDGSTDGSLAICQAFAKKDRRIRVIDIPNGGVSNARNTGIAAATGEYLQFVDSDDTIRPQMTAALVRLLETHGADIAFCSGTVLYYDEKGHITLRQPLTQGRWQGPPCLEHADFLRRLPWLLHNRGGMEGPCNRLYRRRIFAENGLQFPTDTSYGEDFLCNIACYAVCGRVVFCDGRYYNYHRRSETSLSLRHVPHLYENQMRLIDTLQAMLAANLSMTPELQSQIDLYRCRYLYNVICTIARRESEVPYPERLRQLQALLDDDSFCRRYLALDFDFDHARRLAPHVQAHDAAAILQEFEDIHQQMLKDRKRPVTFWLVHRLQRLHAARPDSAAGRLANILALNLATVGFATTCRRILHKLLRRGKDSAE